MQALTFYANLQPFEESLKLLNVRLYRPKYPSLAP